jgi:hypothetical protein
VSVHPAQTNVKARGALRVLGIALAISTLPLERAEGATLPFTGLLSIRFGSAGPFTAAGAGLATVNASGGGLRITSLELPAGAFETTLSVPVANAAPISGVLVTASNAAGAFSISSGGLLAGAMPLAGVAKVCLFNGAPGCASPVTNLVIPLGVVGAGGTLTASGDVTVTVEGAPWFAALGGSAPSSGFAHGPASATGTTAQPGGALQLVTSVFVDTSLAAAPFLFAFGTLDITFVPEPGTLALVGAGVVGLLALRRRL